MTDGRKWENLEGSCCSEITAPHILKILSRDDSSFDRVGNTPRAIIIV
jgi:hypothetical protein